MCMRRPPPRATLFPYTTLFRSAPATTDLLAGRVQIVALTPTAVVPHMQSGRLRLLAITQSSRNPLFPDLPTLAELGYPGATVSVWYAMSGPKGLPEDIRRTLEKAMAVVVADPQVKTFMTEIGRASCRERV